MKVNVKKTHPDAVIPKYAKQGDAGLDLVATSWELDEATGIITYGTGLAIEIPKGHVGLIFMRSSVHKTGSRQTNAVGVVDSGYRGEIMVKHELSVPEYSAHVDEVFNKSRGVAKYIDNYYVEGDRIAQLIIIPYPQIELVEADELSETSRGEGGFGSTGK